MLQRKAGGSFFVDPVAPVTLAEPDQLLATFSWHTCRDIWHIVNKGRYKTLERPSFVCFMLVSLLHRTLNLFLTNVFSKYCNYHVSK